MICEDVKRLQSHSSAIQTAVQSILHHSVVQESILVESCSGHLVWVPTFTAGMTALVCHAGMQVPQVNVAVEIQTVCCSQ